MTVRRRLMAQVYEFVIGLESLPGELAGADGEVARADRDRLAAYEHGRLLAYLAQTTVRDHTAPVPCALRHNRRPRTRRQPRQ